MPLNFEILLIYSLFEDLKYVKYLLNYNLYKHMPIYNESFRELINYCNKL